MPGIRGRTVTLKVKFADFQQITRSKSFGEAIDSLADLERLSLGLFEPLLPPSKGVRLLGIFFFFFFFFFFGALRKAASYIMLRHNISA